MSSGLYIIPAIHDPGVQIGHDPVVFSSRRPIMGKTLKIIVSKIMRPSAYIFSMLQWLVFPYVNLAN